MAQKFIPLEQAAKQLGISKERLNELREAGKVRSYRDGSSWKFRGEDLSALADQLSAASAPGSDPALENLEEPSDPSDSILVSDAEVGGGGKRPPSTVIGRQHGKDAGDSDLELSVAGEDQASPGRDPKSSLGASDILASASGSHVLGPSETPPVPSGKFEDLDEIEIDLETESSKIHSDLDLPKAPHREEESDLQLVESRIHERGAPEEGGSEIRLVDDEEAVLSDASGSDITLSAGDSGINLVDPTDSGLALEELELDLSGSSVSSLELDEGSADRIELEEEGATDRTGDAQKDDFLLTPLGEAGDDDSSSQVIALDSEADLQESASAVLSEHPDETAILEPVDEDAAPGVVTAPVGMPTELVSSAHATEFSGANVTFLILCLIIMAVCGIMMLDLLRYMWSWDQPFDVNSTLIEALNFFD